jgi:hypothetical protein
VSDEVREGRAWTNAMSTLAGEGIAVRSAGTANPVVHIITRPGVNPFTWCQGSPAIEVATNSVNRCPRCQRLARMQLDAATVKER